ncbi:MAG: hypothetical protein QGH15_07655 [Kiritimatiellia bacterium]|jgi:hypothetical protein|nr:hypothetical protein [Kiritimatiellia bacterium]
MKVALRITVTWLVLGCPLISSAELPSNNNPDNQIRFATSEGAAARRAQLVRFIWAGGLPEKRLPKVTEDVGAEAFKEHLKGLDQSLVARVDRLEVDILGITSRSYLIHPAKSSERPRLGIVHAGHSPPGNYIKTDYIDSIHIFLKRGGSAAMMHMPQRGWNDDKTAKLPNGKEPVIGFRGAHASHAAVVKLPDHDSSLAPGAGFQPFLEPVILCINHWAAISKGEPDVTMIGLSGGGWTTHMAAALDMRIRLSVPVAGSYPLYLRNKDKGSVGDLEQFFGPMYNEDIAPDGSGGGVATWLEVYALGGHGKGRRQIMVTARYDSCCFRGLPEETVDTFKDIVARTVQKLGHGKWEHVLDTTHRSHQISPWILTNVIEPSLRDNK